MYAEKKLNNYQANRFFLRYSQNTLLGRFYLLHMLCIKPETTDYQISSSCDYSFIPELCPSGNIAIIDDSDDYLVIEMQPQEHEVKHVNFGPYDFERLVVSLAEWTTIQHRENAKKIIYYHTNDMSAETKSKIEARPDPFINALTQALEKHETQPHRNHPYWIGAIKAFNQARNIIKEEKTSNYFDLSSLSYNNRWMKLSQRFLGTPPSVNRWHLLLVGISQSTKRSDAKISSTTKSR